MDRLRRTAGNLRFRYKLIVSYLLLSLVPLTILGVYAYRTSRSRREQQTRDMVSAHLEQTAVFIQGQAERHAQFVTYLSLDRQVRDLLVSDTVNQYPLHYTVNRYIDPMITNYSVLSRQEVLRTVIYSHIWDIPLGLYIQPDSAVREEPWYRQAQSLRSTGWRYAEGRVFVYRPFFSNYSNKFLGVVELELNPETLYGRAGPLSAIPSGMVCAAEDGSLIYARNFSGEAPQPDPSAAAGETGDRLNAEEGAFDLFRRPCPELGMVLLYWVPRGFLAAESGEILAMTVLLIAICTMLLAGMSWLLSLSIVRRLERLDQRVRQVRDGSLDVDFSSRETDEIGNLSNSIGQMLGRIRTLLLENDAVREHEKEARLHLLQAQLNPHFLYNTLSVINWKAIETDNPAISEITQLLSQFYHTTLNKGSDCIRLGDELENVRAYIGLQQIMHEDMLRVEYDVDPALLDCRVVNFILQPFVENAILHGIGNKRPPQDVLRIGGHFQGGAIVLTVSDDGDGFPGLSGAVRAGEWDAASASGYGMKNVEERIRLLCGKESGVWLQNRGGALVTIRLPREFPTPFHGDS